MGNNETMEDTKNPYSDMSDLIEDKIESTLLSNSIHYLTGEITETNVGKAIKWLLYEMCLPGNRQLTLYINSSGGDLDAGFALIDIISQVKNFHTVQIIGLGSVCSAAFLILTTGSTGYRHVFKNTSLMCHQYTAGFEGKHHDIVSYNKETKMCHARMMDHLVETTGMSKSMVKSKLLSESDSWFSPEEAIEYGVIDQIIGSNKN